MPKRNEPNKELLAKQPEWLRLIILDCIARTNEDRKWGTCGKFFSDYPMLQQIYLTPCEFVVGVLVASNVSNKGMSALLNVSIKTIEKHRDSLYKKLHTKGNPGTTVSITHWLIECGIIKPGQYVKDLVQ